MMQPFRFWEMAKRIESRDSKRYLYTLGHNSIIHNSRNVEAYQVSTWYGQVDGAAKCGLNTVENYSAVEVWKL